MDDLDEVYGASIRVRTATIGVSKIIRAISSGFNENRPQKQVNRLF